MLDHVFSYGSCHLDNVRSDKKGVVTMALIGKQIVAIFLLSVSAAPALGAGSCIDVRMPEAVQCEGRLTHKIFPGPPNFENVRKGDKPEPTYILELQKPVCVKGDDSIDENKLIDRVQIFPEPESAENRALFKKLRSLIGKTIVVKGTAPFGAITGHHHAPLLLPITEIMSSR